MNSTNELMISQKLIRKHVIRHRKILILKPITIGSIYLVIGFQKWSINEINLIK